MTITIIGMLAGMVLGALQASRGFAREHATKATILKLHNIIMDRYESYLTRRVPIDTHGMTSQQAAVARLTAIRDLMWLEMPDHFNDFNNSAFASHTPIVTPPALWNIYNQKYLNSPPPTDDHETAECLYLLVSVGNPEAMELFNQSEIGDLDNDGWPEFLDGYGKSIFFLRWAPAFNASDIQPNIMDWANDTEREYARDNDHDPFDPRKVDLSQTDIDGVDRPTGWRMVPIIYSWGRNTGEAGPAEDITGLFKGGDNYHYNGNPYATRTVAGIGSFGMGAPLGSFGRTIIHNHHME